MNPNTPIECIILAGGLGTRLRSAVPDLPKCMAPIAGKPFVQYLINYLLEQGVSKFIFSLGYMHESIETFIQETYPQLNYTIALEAEPLGTGGAIFLACKQATAKNVLVMNGDTMFRIDAVQFMQFHEENQAQCSVALKPMQNFERYGVVEIGQDHKILSFKEKQHYATGLINGGVYALNTNYFLQLPFPEKFSFEKDFLEQYFSEANMLGQVQDEYFIDIGIPEDFERAGRELIDF